MKRLIALFVLSLFLLPSLSHAQDFDAQFKAFEQQNQKSFQHFSDSINKAFAEAMAENMRVFKGEPAKVKDPKPKPATPPSVKPEKVPEDLPKQDPVIDEVKPDKPQPTEDKPGSADETPSPSEQTPVTEPEKQNKEEDPFEEFFPDLSKDDSPAYNLLEMDIFGQNISLMTDIFNHHLKGLKPSDVADFWILLSEWNYQSQLELCQSKRQEYNFNDWAICQLIFKIAENTFPQEYNEQVVFSIFMMNQLGMDAKIGFTPSHLFCLIAIEQQLYGVEFSIIGDRNYYIFELNPSHAEFESFKFSSYNHNFSSSIHPLDMSIREPLITEGNNDSKYNEQTVYIDIHQIELFSTYPQVDIDVYANAKPSKTFCQSIKRIFAPKLRGLSSYDAVSMLLSYVQFSFEYATDDEQFGYEKPFFCEESYYYPKNDCEDRSVLFSFLVRYLLNMDVVLIDYPGHIATAVHFDQPVEGTKFTYRGKSYVVCDPTYIGASIGMEMPEFTPSDRTIIPLEAITY